MSMVRKLMRGILRGQGKRSTMTAAVTVGTVRAGMHQKSENEFLRVAMMNDEINSVTNSEVPAELESMIPDEEEKVVVDIASDEAVITVNPDVLELIAEDQTAEENDVITEQMSVDWSDAHIPVLDPVTGGMDCEPRGLIYDSGDGTVRMIPDPLGVLSDNDISPFFPEVKNPSANVPGRVDG